MTTDVSRGPAFPTTHGTSWKKIETAATVLLVVILPLSFGMCTRAVGNGIFPSFSNESRTVLRPGDFAWFGPGFILGLCSVGLTLDALYRLYVKRTFRNPQTFAGRFAHIEGFGFAKVLFVAGLALALLAAVFIYDNCLVVSGKEIVVNELTSLGKEKRYPLAAIRSGRFVNVWDNRKDRFSHAYHTLQFADGYEFSSRDNFLTINGEIEALCKANNVPFDSVVVVR